jgi:5'(3')-deoxyribonucleotidase
LRFRALAHLIEVDPMTTPNHRPIIAIDMDEVIADALGEHLMRYNRDFASSPQPDYPHPLTIEHLQGRWLWDAVPPERLAVLESYIVSSDFFRVLPVMPHAKRVLRRLQERYNIFIATAAMEVPTSFSDKFHWLAEHFPFIPPSNIVFCGDKSILRADYLIDDNPRQLGLFESGKPDMRSDGDGTEKPSSRREGILYTSPANVNVTGYRRVNGWLDVEKLFLP